MKRLLISLGALVVTALMLISLIPGYGPDQGNYDDEATGEIGPLRYFKTPQTAVLSISRLLDNSDWSTLSQFYQLKNSPVDREALLNGSYFQSSTQGRPLWQPFPSGFEFVRILGTEHKDVYEIVVRKPPAGDEHDDEPGNLRFFYMQRYPEGYRIIPERPGPLFDRRT